MSSPWELVENSITCVVCRQRKGEKTEPPTSPDDLCWNCVDTIQGIKALWEGQIDEMNRVLDSYIFGTPVPWLKK